MGREWGKILQNGFGGTEPIYNLLRPQKQWRELDKNWCSNKLAHMAWGVGGRVGSFYYI
jgi:hypothetical protein